MEYYKPLIGDPLDGETLDQYIRRAVMEKRQQAVGDIRSKVGKIRKYSDAGDDANGQKWLDKLYGNSGELPNVPFYFGKNRLWETGNPNRPTQSYRFGRSFGRNSQVLSSDPEVPDFTVGSVLNSYGVKSGLLASYLFKNNPGRYGFSINNSGYVPSGSISLKNRGNLIDSAYMYLNDYNRGRGSSDMFTFGSNDTHLGNAPIITWGVGYEDYYYPEIYRRTASEIEADSPVNYSFIGTPKQRRKWTNQYDKYMQEHAPETEEVPVVGETPAVVVDTPKVEVKEKVSDPVAPSWYMREYDAMRKKHPGFNDKAIHRAILSGRRINGDDMYMDWRNSQWRYGGNTEMFAKGGPTLDKTKVYNRIPSNAMMLGLTPAMSAVLQYYLNDDDYVGNYISEVSEDEKKLKNASEEEIRREYDKRVGKDEKLKSKYNSARDWADNISLSNNEIIALEDAKDVYLGMPQRNNTIYESRYSPSLGEEGRRYYTSSFFNHPVFLRDHVMPAYNRLYTKDFGNDDIVGKSGNNMTTILPMVGHATVGKGRDGKGDYVSIYDKWDVGAITPFEGGAGNRGVVDNMILGDNEAPEFYERVYLDDYYGVPDENRDYNAHYLPMVTVRPKYQTKGEVPSYLKPPSTPALLTQYVPVKASKPDFSGFAENAKKELDKIQQLQQLKNISKKGGHIFYDFFEDYDINNIRQAFPNMSEDVIKKIAEYRKLVSDAHGEKNTNKNELEQAMKSSSTGENIVLYGKDMGKDNGTVVNTGTLDSIATHAINTNTPFSIAFGLPARESTYGKAEGRDTSPYKMMSMWDYNSQPYKYYVYFPYEISNNDTHDDDVVAAIDETMNEYYKNIEKLRYTEKRNGIPFKMNPWDWAFEYAKKGFYNPGDKGYINKVKQNGRQILSAPKFQDWLQQYTEQHPEYRYKINELKNK